MYIKAFKNKKKVFSCKQLQHFRLGILRHLVKFVRMVLILRFSATYFSIFHKITTNSMTNRLTNEVYYYFVLN